MGKVVRVKNSRKEWKCSKCGNVIPAGSEYLKGELNFARPIIRCCKCGLESWEVTTSDYQLSVGEVVYRWHENYEPTEEGRDSIVSDLEDIKSDLEDRLDNMPEGLRDGDTGCLLQERIDSLDSAIDELNDIDFDDDDSEEDEEEREDRYREEIDSALGNIEI